MKTTKKWAVTINCGSDNHESKRVVFEDLISALNYIDRSITLAEIEGEEITSHCNIIEDNNV